MKKGGWKSRATVTLNLKTNFRQCIKKNWFSFKNQKSDIKFTWDSLFNNSTIVYV
jgi:hypothetical protein